MRQELSIKEISSLGIISEKAIIAFIVALALFMDAMDTTIINTAIPAMAQSLQVNPVDLKIALISYLLSLSVFIPISGHLGDRFGVKQVFIAALGVFTISSAWCGCVQTLPELVLARALQGTGGALMIPLGRLIMLRTFHKHELVDAMNHVVIVVSVGLMLGPLAGGFITDHLSWHWIFWVNIPVGIFAMIIAYIWFKDDSVKKSRPFNVLGFFLFGGGLAGLTFSLSDLSESTADERTALRIMGVAIFMLITYFFYSRQQRHPIINTQLFKIRTFRISLIGNLICRLGFGGVPFLLPLLLQVGLGYPAQLSGALLVPIAFGILTTKYFSLKILRLMGYKRLLIINTIMVGLLLWGFQIINQHTSIVTIAILTFSFGLLISMQFSGMNSLGYADITQDDLSSAASIVSTIQQVAQSFGVAASALLLRVYSIPADEYFTLTPNIFHQTFFALGVITMLTAFLFLYLKSSDGYQMLTEPVQGKVTALAKIPAKESVKASD